MTQNPKRKETPSEPLKRVLGLAVRAIAGDGEIEVTYGGGKPALEGKVVRLAEPSRVPNAGEIAVLRGWADSLALTAACHDEGLHRTLAPPAGPAREVFEAMERARVEALGANRMQRHGRQSRGQVRGRIRPRPLRAHLGSRGCPARQRAGTSRPRAPDGTRAAGCCARTGRSLAPAPRSSAASRCSGA